MLYSIFCSWKNWTNALSASSMPTTVWPNEANQAMSTALPHRGKRKRCFSLWAVNRLKCFCSVLLKKNKSNKKDQLFYNCFSILYEFISYLWKAIWFVLHLSCQKFASVFVGFRCDFDMVFIFSLKNKIKIKNEIQNFNINYDKIKLI